MIYLSNKTTSQRVFIPRNETYSGATGYSFSLQSKDYVINQNGLTVIHPDAGYDGISGGSISVYVSAATGVTFENLVATQNGLYAATGDTVYTGVTVNVNTSYDDGYHDGFENGYTSGRTNGRLEGYSSGVTDGRNEQKSLLSELHVTRNGVYTSETGYSGVTVNVTSGTPLTHVLTVVIKTTKQNEWCYLNVSLNLGQIYIRELEEYTNQSYYVFSTPGTYTLDYYTEGEPKGVLGVEKATDINITCDSIDHLILYSDASTSSTITAVTFVNGTDIKYIPHAFCAGGWFENVTAITIPDTVIEVGSIAFAELTNLNRVVLGENVYQIGAGTFSDCSNLTHIISKRMTPPIILDDSTFLHISPTGTLTVPYGSDYGLFLTKLPSGWEIEYY